MPLEYKYTLSDAVRPPLWGPALWGALWVYLIGRSPPAPLGLLYGVPFGYTLSDAVRLPLWGPALWGALWVYLIGRSPAFQ